ncbi:hypothetical protein [Nocardia bovistercoris]|nr:hypothetical protein [Nocardia bovistercoris]
MSARPLVASMVIAQHLAEYGATAVVVPAYEHAEPWRVFITDACSLITPVHRYPRGHRWPVADLDVGRL